MFYALNEDNKKVFPSPKSKAICPVCKEEVIAKCGEINAWHWAHKSNTDCDDWSEFDSQWHLLWKKRYPKENCEINIKGRRADIVTNNEIIKLQSSNISPEKIASMEDFFQSLVWIFNVQESAHNIEFRKKENYFTFRWKYPKKHIAYTKKPTILDLGDDKLFILKMMHKKTPCGGWGYFINVEDFLKVKFYNSNKKFIKKVDSKGFWEGRD